MKNTPRLPIVFALTAAVIGVGMFVGFSYAVGPAGFDPLELCTAAPGDLGGAARISALPPHIVCLSQTSGASETVLLPWPGAYWAAAVLPPGLGILGLVLWLAKQRSARAGAALALPEAG